MKTLHASGLWSTPTAAVRAQIAAWIKEHAPAELTHTEAAKHRDAFTRHDGYGVAHPFGVDGQAECAIQYRLDGPTLLTSKAVPLSALPIPRRSGDLCYATYAEFEDHHLIALHLPSGVEGADGLLDNAQARVYRDAIGGLRRFVATLDDRPVRIVGDWNLDLGKTWVRKYLGTPFPDFTPTVVPPSEGGTHGKRLIDFSLVRGYTARGEVIDNPTSDHRAISERITKETAVTQRRLTDLADVLRAAGLKVVELDGWKTRGRPESTGGFAPVGNLWHHTGAEGEGREYADWMALKGRSDLPPPLCQVAIDRAGACYVSAAGRANHAGKAKASGPVPAGDGNELYIGWECMNTGTEGWTREQYDAMTAAGAATSRAYGWTAAANRAHKETSTTGKWDPGALDMDKFRADIAARMTTRREDIDMAPETAETIRTIVREEIANAKLNLGGGRVVNDDTIARGLIARLDRIEAALKAKG